MPYRARKIDWNLLLRPTMAGIATSGQASARLSDTIRGAGSSIGAGLVRSRQEDESKRRYKEQQAESRRRNEQDLGLRQQALDLRKSEFDLKKADLDEQRDFATERYNSLMGTMGEFEKNPNEQTAAAVQGVVKDFPGGADAARAAVTGQVQPPTSSMVDCPPGRT